MPESAFSQAENSFFAWLDERCIFLRRLEKEAAAIAQAESNSERYHALMLQKALSLANLADEAAPYLEALSPAMTKAARERFARFARNAEQAIDLDSIFYMSALLYPEDYKEGQPNDLEAFLAALRATRRQA